MLTDKKTITIGDHIFVDIVPESEFVQIRLEKDGRKEVTQVRKVDLYGAVFALADAKTQDALIPVRQTQMTTYKRIHTVKLKKGMREGELLRVKCEINVPTVVEEGLRGTILQKRSKGSTLLLPR